MKNNKQQINNEQYHNKTEHIKKTQKQYAILEKYRTMNNNSNNEHNNMITL